MQNPIKLLVIAPSRGIFTAWASRHKVRLRDEAIYIGLTESLLGHSSLESKVVIITGDMNGTYEWDAFHYEIRRKAVSSPAYEIVRVKFEDDPRKIVNP